MRTRDLYGAYEFDAFSAQNMSLQSQWGGMNVNSMYSPFVTCEFCARNHESVECQEGNQFFFSSTEQVNYMDSSQGLQNDFFSNTYSFGWESHPNLSWSNQCNQPNQGIMSNHQPMVNPQPYEQETSKVDDTIERISQMIDNFVHESRSTNGFMNEPRENIRNQGEFIQNLEFVHEQRLSKLEDTLESFMQETHLNLQSQAKSIRNLEVQMAKLVEKVTERSQCSSASTTVSKI